MRNKAISVTIVEPCSQNWDLMEDRNSERFCESCQKCVVDFSKHSNSEIVKVLSSSKNDICGRITNTQLAQLSYYLITVPTNKNWLKYLGVLAIGASLFMGEARATGFKETVEVIDSSFKIASNEKKTMPKKIYGYVYDENRKPVSGIRIVILNTKLFAKTNRNGRYEIVMNENSISPKILIKVESLNFEGATKINYATAKQQNLYLKSVYMIMGKIEISSKN